MRRFERGDRPHPLAPSRSGAVRRLGVLVVGLMACGPPSLEDLDASSESEVIDFIEAHRDDARIPGLAACIVRDAELAWCRGFGLAHVDELRPVTPDTPFLLASVTKLVTATSVMQLVEDDALTLDQPVRDLVGFEVAHPEGAAITVEQLLTHTGSIRDSDAIDSFYEYDSDPVLSLHEINEGYFAPGGRWYDAGTNFLADPPRTRFSYSNMGYTLAGYVVEAVAERPFTEVTHERIFTPLGMEDTGWYRTDFDLTEVAMPYEAVGRRWEPVGHYTIADYPDGGLRSSARDMARFLIATIRDGELDGARILEAETLASMFVVDDVDPDEGQGLGWARFEWGGQWWWGHDGSDEGVFTDLNFRETDRMGFVLLTNLEADEDRILEIEAALVRFADEGLELD